MSDDMAGANETIVIAMITVSGIVSGRRTETRRGRGTGIGKRLAKGIATETDTVIAKKIETGIEAKTVSGNESETGIGTSRQDTRRKRIGRSRESFLMTSFSVRKASGPDGYH